MALSRTPPFEAPHHSASVAALVGGGSRVVRPGAIARATEGVLFLDEAGEFQASALDALRQPLESGTITIHRATATAQFPARFQLVLATNPCPCGDYGIRGGTCTCLPAAIRRYLGRLSGPLLDRIDIELTLARVSVAQRGAQRDGEHRRRRCAPVARRRGAGARRAAPRAGRRGGSTPSSRAPGCATVPERRPRSCAVRSTPRCIAARSLCADTTACCVWPGPSPTSTAAPQLSADHIGRALYLKKGIAL